MLVTILSGGQSGVDQAGWRAAVSAGFPTGGWMPRGYLTEDGHRPEFARLFGATEHSSAAYPPRTRANAEYADATIVITAPVPSRGTELTLRILQDLAPKPFLVIPFSIVGGTWRPTEYRHVAFQVACWIRNQAIATLNVAGPRASEAPGLGDQVEVYLAEVLRRMKEWGD